MKTKNVLSLVLLLIISLFASVIHADNVEDLLFKSGDYENELKYGKALKYLKEAYELDPIKIAVNTGLGRVYRKLGDYENSLKYYNNALKVGSTNISIDSVYYDIGITYNEMEKPEKALEAFNIYISKSGEKKQYIDPEVYFYFGNAYQDLKQYDEAIKNYKIAVEKIPYDITTTCYNMALCYYKISQYGNAIETLQKLTKYDDRRAWLFMAKCYIEMDQLKLAEETLKQGLAKKPKRPELHYNLGVVYLLQGRKQDAVQEYEQTKKLHKDLAKHLDELLKGKILLDKTQVGWVPPQKPRKGPPKYKIILTHPAPSDEDLDYVPMIDLVN